MLALARDGTQLTLKSPFQSHMLPLTEAGIQLCHLNRAVRGQIPAEQKLLSKFANFLAKKKFNLPVLAFSLQWSPLARAVQRRGSTGLADPRVSVTCCCHPPWYRNPPTRKEGESL